MRYALHAEWTKVRTLTSPLWLLAGSIAATVALSAAVTSVVTCDRVGCGVDATKISLSGVELGQAPVAVLAVLAISTEYSTGMIRITLAATPNRTIVLAAKAVTLTGIVAAAGTVAVLGSLVTTRSILPGRGFATAHGYPTVNPIDTPTLRAAVGTIIYLALIALLSLGIATAVQDSAAGVGIVLALLYLFPILAEAIGAPHWQRLLEQIGPMSAGLAIQATTDSSTLPISPWAGLGITAGWAAAALLVGGARLHWRDF